jgi:hypothetical protein
MYPFCRLLGTGYHRNSLKNADPSAASSSFLFCFLRKKKSVRRNRPEPIRNVQAKPRPSLAEVKRSVRGDRKKEQRFLPKKRGF